MNLLLNSVLCLFVVVAIALFLGVRHGRDLKEHGGCPLRHARYMNVALVLILTSIGIIEVFKQLHGGIEYRWLLLFHLLFAIPFLTLFLLLRFWITGTSRYKAYHPMLGYLCFALYEIGVLSTGFIMLSYVKK